MPTLNMIVFMCYGKKPSPGLTCTLRVDEEKGPGAWSLDVHSTLYTTAVVWNVEWTRQSTTLKTIQNAWGSPYDVTIKCHDVQSHLQGTLYRRVNQRQSRRIDRNHTVEAKISHVILIFCSTSVEENMKKNTGNSGFHSKRRHFWQNLYL